MEVAGIAIVLVIVIGFVLLHYVHDEGSFMKISKKGLALLKEWEGSRARVYRDAAGLPTIGVGHLLTKSELSSGKIVIGDIRVDFRSLPLSDPQIIKLLEQDVSPCVDAVNRSVKVPLSQERFDTLVSFAFNVGIGAFVGSTLLRMLNAGKYDEVPGQLARWTRAGGRQVQGLVNRRTNEIALWQGKL